MWGGIIKIMVSSENCFYLQYCISQPNVGIPKIFNFLLYVATCVLPKFITNSHSWKKYSNHSAPEKSISPSPAGTIAGFFFLSTVTKRQARLLHLLHLFLQFFPVLTIILIAKKGFRNVEYIHNLFIYLVLPSAKNQHIIKGEKNHIFHELAPSWMDFSFRVNRAQMRREVGKSQFGWTFHWRLLVVSQRNG